MAEEVVQHVIWMKLSWCGVLAKDTCLNNWLRHLPTEMVKAHLGFRDADTAKIPAEKLEVLS